MTGPATIDQIKIDASREQHRASKPRASAFVSANAGAGKTHVLVGRVIRLMLDGVQPERILCLTYTRAAAAEMSKRLFDTLAGWIAMDDETLVSAIHGKIGHAEFKPEKTDLARRLFTRALETPGGLKVQTIHAFCERLLQRFPVEAGVMPGFSVLDETAERELLEEARARVLASAAPDLAAYVETVVNHASEQTLVQLLKGLVGERLKLIRHFGSSNRFADLRASLNAKLGVSESDDAAAIRRNFVQNTDWRGLGDVAQSLREVGGSTNVKQAEAIDAAGQAGSIEDMFDEAAAFLLKADGQPKAAASLLTKKCADRFPEALQSLIDAQEAYVAATSRIKSLTVRDATEALVAVALAVIAEYEALKQQASAYDYADLINRTVALLNEDEAAAWVLYRLDRGIDHILIDEAQDTSPDQWEIVGAIADEFFAGEGARPDEPRTMFAVGDRKQSIYSFQGADPDVFEARLAGYRDKVLAAKGAFEDVGLHTSFRSSKAVLAAVDRVFGFPDVARGVVPAGGEPVRHTPSRLNADGLVEIWEIERQPKSTRSDPWQDEDGDAAPAPEEPANVRLAQRIARTIQRWLDPENPEKLGEGVLVRPDDILILVRERASLMEAIVRALKDAQVPVAGADRLQMLNHIAAQDLIALGRFAILPEDDLNLAGLLKSPLLARDDGERFNDDDDIFVLAHGRGETSLWQRLKGLAPARGYTTALKRLTHWREEAGRTGVYRFFANVLARDKGRAALLAAVGQEAGEPVDAFLQQCLEYEREGPSTMAGFLAWLEATSASLKRDMEQGSGEVRVMTVHGAKGLEAPIVILPDTCSMPNGSKVGSVVFDSQDGSDLPVWRLKSDFEVEYTRGLKYAALDKLLEEYNRLLYVAMTRARDRLYVCGFKKSRKEDWESDEPDEGTWYHSIRRALVDGDLPAIAHVDDGRTTWRFGSGHIGDLKQPDIVTMPADFALPAWATSPAPPTIRPERWLAPSRLAEQHDGENGWQEEVGLSPLAPKLDETRFRRGELVHRLLQSLPGLPEADREPAARRFLTRRGLAEPEISSTVTEILALFADERFAEVFSPAARAEVSIAALIAPPHAERFGLSGQIDRLLITDTRVLVVDFKTNRPPPASVDAVPESYVRQLAAYAHVLAGIYPGHSVECALLWTDAPSLMPVPADRLDRAWQGTLFKSPSGAPDPA